MPRGEEMCYSCDHSSLLSRLDRSPRNLHSERSSNQRQHFNTIHLPAYEAFMELDNDRRQVAREELFERHSHATSRRSSPYRESSAPNAINIGWNESSSSYSEIFRINGTVKSVCDRILLLEESINQLETRLETTDSVASGKKTPRDGDTTCSPG